MLDLGALNLKVKVDGVEETESKLNGIKSTVHNTAQGLKNGVAKIGKAMAVGVATAGTAIFAMTKKAVDNYAEYEQLVGGIETLFKDSADKVKEYANQAYKTAGLSANEYMETATSFSASLLQSLGGDTEKAADYANKAIVDMSDNANKMGTSMESIQNAYQGFAKQNYTMLDNLKLGYGGTKEEMQRLLEDAEKISGQKFDLSSYADIVDAIHIVQEEMDITGTTAEESSETIEGSINTMKSAWENLLTGMGDEDADMQTLIQNFVDSVGDVATNLIPVFEQALDGAGQLIDTILPIIIDKIPTLITTYLPKIVQSGVDIILSLIQGISENPDQIVDTIIECIDILIDGIIQCLPQLIVTGSLLIIKLAVGLIKAIPDLVAKVPEIITSLIDEFSAHKDEFLSSGKELLQGWWDGFKAIWGSVIEWIGEICGKVIEKFKGTSLYETGSEILTSLWDGLKSIWTSITGWIDEKVGWIKDKFNEAKDAVSGLLGLDDGKKKDGSHRTGLREVPYDGYMAELHKGEMILTSAEANNYQSQQASGNGVTNNITVNNYSPKALNEVESARQFRNTQRHLALGF